LDKVFVIDEVYHEELLCVRDTTGVKEYVEAREADCKGV
jgi:hypothetical protein